MDNKEFQNKMADYFDNQLNEAEKVTFIESIKSDKSKYNEFLLEQKIYDSITKSEYSNFQNSVQIAQNSMINKTKTTFYMKNRTFLTIAASLLVLVAAVFLFKNNTSNAIDADTYQALLKDFEKEELGKYALRGGGKDDNIRDSIALALNESTKGSIREARTLLQTLYQSHPEDINIKVLLGINHYKVGEYSAAINILSPILNDLPKDLKEEAEMAVAMSSRFVDDGGKSHKKWLTKIANSTGHKYQDVARDYL